VALTEPIVDSDRAAGPSLVTLPRRERTAVGEARYVAAACHNRPMERVLGIGGFFFKSADPAALSQWYETHLGVAAPPPTVDGPVWRQQAGDTVFAPFGAENWGSQHLGRSGWGINFRVRDIDEMVAQLRLAEIDVVVDPFRYANGRFAHLNDPEGNPVQLWQPA
jgi:glyoxylase I family protein